MISYELAKQLKQAGFPQRGANFDSRGLRRFIQDPYREVGMPKDTDFVYVPLLSELIEACGNDWRGFEALTKEHSQEGDSWVASAFHITAHGRGSTPEEAVARLWLTLHNS